MSIFGSDSETPAEKARHDVRYRLHELVDRLTVDGYGATRREVPIEGYRVLTRAEFDPPITGLQAALRIHTVASGLVYERAMHARAGGATWAEIGAALGITDPEDAPAEAAYRHLVWDAPLPGGEPSWQRRESSASWVCRACGQRITDRGPWEANPANTEDGHASDCARAAAEQARYRSEFGIGDE